MFVGKAHEDLAAIKKSVLGKSTLRCVDYRKAAILVSQAFRKADVHVDADIQMLVDTAVEICEIMYSQDNMRTQRNILRLHNITFLHGRLCVTLLSNPKSISQRKMFGTYFHSLMCHSAQLYRIINLRSLNAEHQERTFNQLNSISQQTSNRHPQHVIDNAIIRIQAEKGVNGLMRDVTRAQESEVSKLASTWQHPGNTTFTSAYIDSHSLLFQAHLERICEFLLPGHGVWWKYTATGIEFLDGPGEENKHYEGPSLQHYRSCKMEDISQELINTWEKCLRDNITLPVSRVWKYGSDGNLAVIDSVEDTMSHNNSNCTTDHNSSEMVPTLSSSSEAVQAICDTASTCKTTSKKLNLVPAQRKENITTKLRKSLLEIMPERDLILQFDKLRAEKKNRKKKGKYLSKENSSKLLYLSNMIKDNVKKSYKKYANDGDTKKAAKCIQILHSEWKEDV